MPKKHKKKKSTTTAAVNNNTVVVVPLTTPPPPSSSVNAAAPPPNQTPPPSLNKHQPPITTPPLTSSPSVIIEEEETTTMSPTIIIGDSTIITPVPGAGIISVPTLSPVLTAVRDLLKVIDNYNGSTVNGLISELKSANHHNYATTKTIETKCKLAVRSACAQFIRYATLTLSSIEADHVSKCKEQMLSEGLKYLRTCERSIDKISRWAVTLIFDGAHILVHSDSFVVLETLRSVPKNIYFSVYIVIDNDSVAKYFADNFNIEVKTIRDAEVATLMEGMDLVMVGAEAVLKNGGIVNKVGTFPLAICAKEMNKPMYVLAESFKFSLMYPMSQKDLPKEIRYESIDSDRIRVDYTLPKYITFLVTDRGLLTPTAVCDELIELYT